MQLAQSRQFRSSSCDDDFPIIVQRDPLHPAILTHPPVAFDTQPRLQRACLVIHSGMEYAAVSSAGMLTGRRFFLDYYDLGTVPTAELARNGYANYPCTYHQKIVLRDSHCSSNLPLTLIRLRISRGHVHHSHRFLLQLPAF